MKVAIVGYGYWGPKLVRNFNSVNDCFVKYVCDALPERLTPITKQYPGIITTNQFDDILNDEEVEAIIIATPVFTHFDLAKRALLKGKNVLIEKPMTST